MRSRGFLRTKPHLGLCLLYMLSTSSQGIQLHSHFKVKTQASGAMEVLFLLWKQRGLEGEKTSQRQEKIQFGSSVVLTSQRQFLLCFQAFWKHCKIPKPQKLQISTCGLLLRKWRQGCKNRWELSASSEMICLRRCFICGAAEIKQSQKILGTI